MPTPQLLMLYNSRFNARTIRDHVTHLLSHDHVWWGRFYAGPQRFDATAAATRWPHVADLAAERAATSEPTLLFASNHVALHVFLVSRIALGDSPDGGVRAEALPYYADLSVPLWFRVDDARALSYEHPDTNEWLEERLGAILGGSKRSDGAPFTHGFDPAASIHNQYPIVIEGPSAAELFAPATRPKGMNRWAEAPGTMSPRPVERALERLAGVLEPRVWDRTSSEARECLAHAWLVRTQLERGEDIHPSNGFNNLARAVEIELRDELLVPLERLAERRELRGILESIEVKRGTDRNGPRKWTMGTLLGFLQRLVTHHRRELESLDLKPLVSLSLGLRWLESIQPLRNEAVHGNAADSAESREEARRVLYEFFGAKGEMLGAILDAGGAVKKALAMTRR